MLTALVRFSLRYRLVVLLAAGVLVACGLEALRGVPWDVFPEFAPPRVVVQTEAPGFSAEQVERLVTIPVESAMASVPRLEVLRSSSAPGLSVVTAIFAKGTDVLDARQLANERLAELDRLPDTVLPPRLTPLKASTSKLLMLGLTSETVPADELRTLADWTLLPRLGAVPGVAQVEVFGGDVKEYQVLFDPQRMQQYGVSLQEVEAAARSASGLGGAGFVETANQRFPIRQHPRIRSAADIAAAPLALREGIPLTLGHVADVRTGAALKVGDATIGGEPGVLLVLHKQPAFDTLAVTASVERAIADLRPSLPEGVTLREDLFRQATFIERAIGNLNGAILLGAALVAVVLIAFLFQWRTVVISLTAVPLSLLGAILVLRGFGASLNAMTLGGLAIALGELVDDAIVDVENVLRRLRENRRADNPRPALQVVLSASLEIRSAVVYASFIVVLVFVPVFFLGGLAGTLFRPLGLAYVTSILVSLLVALTVTPALCLVLLRNEGERQTPPRDPLLVRALKRLYLAVLPFLLRHRFATLGGSLLLLAGAGSCLPFLGGEFLPEFRETNFVVFMAGKPDSSLGESVRAGRLVSRRLLDVPGVTSVTQQIGRAELSEDTWGPNILETWVTIDSAADYEVTLCRIREAVENVPGYAFQVKQFLRERIDEVLTGARAPIVLRIAGPSLETLREQGTAVAEAIRNVEGLADLRVEQQVEVPQIGVTLLPREAARYGFSVGELNRTLRSFVNGSRVGEVYEGDAVFAVMLRARLASGRREPAVSRPSRRNRGLTSPARLGRLLLDAPNGERIPLEAVARVGFEPAPNVINREAGSRRILVTANTSGRDVAGVLEDIRRRIRERVEPLPTGYRLEYAGESQAQEEGRQRLLLLAAAAIVGIFVLLYLDLGQIEPAVLILLSVPFAWVGGVAAVMLGGGPAGAAGGSVSLGSLVGFVTVFGIAVRNAILLVTHFRHLQIEEGVPFGRDLILRGAAERLAPILMTAASTALALLPLVLQGEKPGHEIEHPMAIVIVGGLVSSTFLTLFLLPMLYEWRGGCGAGETAADGVEGGSRVSGTDRQEIGGGRH